MADAKPIIPPAPEPEKFAVSAEEFAALKAKAGEVDKMSVLLGEMKRARRVDQLISHAKETFAYIPVAADMLAEKFAALEEHDAKLFEFFDGLLATMDKQIATGNLFSQVGTGLANAAPESFDALIEKVLADKFSGDRGKYADAMSLARKQRPDLFAEYSDTYSVPEHKKS